MSYHPKINKKEDLRFQDYKGNFGSEQEVWSKYPQGGQYGWFCMVIPLGSFMNAYFIYWDKDLREWKEASIYELQTILGINPAELNEGDIPVWDIGKKKFIIKTSNIWNKLIDTASSFIQTNNFFDEVEDIPTEDSDPGIYFVHKDTATVDGIIEFRAYYLVLGGKAIKIFNSSDYRTRIEVDSELANKADQTQVDDIADSVDVLSVTKAEKSVVDALMNGIIKQPAVDTYNDTSNGKTSLLNEYTNPQSGWDVLVREDETKGGKSNRYNWNNTIWVDMETGLYDENIMLSGGTIKTGQQLDDEIVTVSNKLGTPEPVYEDKTDSSTKKVGFYLNKTDGLTEIENPAFTIIDLDVTNKQGVRIFGRFGWASAIIVWLSDNGTVLAIHTIPQSETGQVQTIVQAKPDGAVLARVSYTQGYNEKFEVYGVTTAFEELKEVNKNVEKVDKKIGNTEFESKSDKSYLITRGGAFLSDGTFSATGGQNWGYAENIDVTGIDGINIYTRFAATIAFVIWHMQDGSRQIITGDSSNLTELRYFAKPVNAITADLSVIDTTLNYTVEFIYPVNSASISSRGINKINPLQSLPALIVIPIFGQSLSVGAASTPVISAIEKYGIGRMFQMGVRANKKAVTDFKELLFLREIISGATSDSAGVGETPATGTCEKFIEAVFQENGIETYSTLWDNHLIVFASCGLGSNTIAMLLDNSSGMSAYDGLKNFVQACKNIADTNIWSVKVPAWCMIQGETDLKNGTTDYKDQLLNLQTMMNTDLKAITGQTDDCICILYQTGNQNINGQTTPNFASTNMNIPTAQMELIRDNEQFVASIPVYSLDHSTAEPIHLANTGSKILGAYQGYSLKKLLIDGMKHKGVVPLSYTVSGNDIIIKYNVPCPPLQFDTNYVKEVPNMGYNVIKSDDTQLITGVELWNDTATIHCSESPLGCKLRYAFNGTLMKDGRKLGSRGNLRDSQGNIMNIDIQGTKYPLHNWAYGFEYLIN